ncbi:MAG: T9SS type A sorting domain-containing protein [Chitinophagales bacterium]|nr:T9SS type A sorting domain-containing protein [Bacteroidota bacterium]
MKNSKFHIKEYSLFAASFLLIKNDIGAEVIYGDIIPDTLINEEWETYTIDLNYDGVSDFRFLKRSFWFMPTSSSTSHFNAIYAGPLVFGNLIAGNPHVIFPSYGGSTVYHPYALAEGAIIDQNSLDFQNAGYQELAYRFLGENSTYWPNGGHWYPEVVDRYLGVYFKDTANCYHYGWIRLDVKDFGRELVIKDFAYETECNHPIVAGDTISYVDVAEENKLDAVIYSYGNTIYVTLNEQYNDVQLSVADITGKEIYSNQITEKFTDIPLNEPKGIYIVTIISGKNKYSKKVIIN